VLISTATALAAGLVAVPGATAARVSSLSGGVLSNVEWSTQGPVLHGHISSVDYACLANRIVVISRPGPRQVAQGRTDVNGYWTITLRGWDPTRKVTLWAWVKSAPRRGSLLCEGGAATRTVLYLPSVTKQYTSICTSAWAIMGDINRLVTTGSRAGRNMMPAVRDEARASQLMYKAEYDRSIFDARADAARARWFAALARAEAQPALGG
jgi:hypothetical protein